MNMLQSYAPVGKFIFRTYKHPEVLAGDSALQSNLKDLVSSLKENIKEYGVIDAQKKMEDVLFSLRFEILEYLRANPGLLESIEDTIVEQIGEKYFTSGKFKELGKSISDTLEIYLLMFGAVAGEIKNNIASIGPVPNDLRLVTLSSLKHINSLQPNPEFAVVIEWFSASVRYDFYLIASEFVMNNEIVIDENQVSLLASALKTAISDFGVYTILSGLWQPKADDGNQIVRNIKIKAAAHRMNAGSGKSISLNNLQDLLLS